MIKKFKNESCFTHIMKCEDHFMMSDTFQGGFGSVPRKSSLLAYGTILNYENFDKAWEQIKDNYSVECWKEMCEYWIYQGYLSPIPVLFSMNIYRKLGLEFDLERIKS